MERTVEVVPAAGLHARPASSLVQTVNTFDATVEIGRATDGDELVSANSMLAVTGLNVAQGQSVTIAAEGPNRAAETGAAAAVRNNTVREDGEGVSDI